jgi:hypothetical protein
MAGGPLGDRLLAWLVASAALGVAIAGAFELATEQRVSLSESIVATQAAAITRGAVWSPPLLGNALDQPARALVADALIRARVAQREANPEQRARTIGEARDLITRAESLRSDWPEALTVEAYIDSLDHGPLSPETMDALARSYLAAPFLRETGPWRVQAGLKGWARLSEKTQRSVVDEAVWIGRLSKPQGQVIFALARDSGAYVPFMRRWAIERTGDADRLATRADRPAP